MISVIIPNYNHAPYLRERIESVLKQTYSANEIILLDDCSTDNSREVIKQFANISAVKQVVYNRENSGSTFLQWKKGVALASGEYIWIAESDDFADIHFLEKCMKVFKHNKNVGLVYSQSVSIDENGIAGESWLKHTAHFNEVTWGTDFVMAGTVFVMRYMLLQNSLPNASAVVFKKQLYDDVGGVDTSYKLNGDWDLYTRLLWKSDIGYISSPLNFFRQHNKKGSSGNILNGNNIAEYYWLLEKWKGNFTLPVSVINQLSTHIFTIWKNQCGGSLKKMLQTNFKKIFCTAFHIDKKVLLKIFR